MQERRICSTQTHETTYFGDIFMKASLCHSFIVEGMSTREMQKNVIDLQENCICFGQKLGISCRKLQAVSMCTTCNFFAFCTTIAGFSPLKRQAQERKFIRWWVSKIATRLTQKKLPVKSHLLTFVQFYRWISRRCWNEIKLREFHVWCNVDTSARCPAVNHVFCGVANWKI